jgi:hypothetical protein
MALLFQKYSLIQLIENEPKLQISAYSICKKSGLSKMQCKRIATYRVVGSICALI